jgi:protein-arginine kinase activator protein McsA
LRDPCVHATQISSPSKQGKSSRHEKRAESVELSGCGRTGLGGEKVDNDVGLFELAHRHEQSDGCSCCDTRQFEVAHDGLTGCVSTYQAVTSHQRDES